MKSPRAIGERFCSKLRFGKRRNTLCISSFSNRKVGTKDSLNADGYLFRVSLILLSDNGREEQVFLLLVCSSKATNTIIPLKVDNF